MAHSIHYENSMELSDGRTLRIDFVVRHYPASYTHPPEDDASETYFRLAGKSIDREDLPGEVTDEIIAELEFDATPCKDTDSDGPVDSPEDDMPDYPF